MIILVVNAALLLGFLALAAVAVWPSLVESTSPRLKQLGGTLARKLRLKQQDAAAGGGGAAGGGAAGGGKGGDDGGAAGDSGDVGEGVSGQEEKGKGPSEGGGCGCGAARCRVAACDWCGLRR